MGLLRSIVLAGLLVFGTPAAVVAQSSGGAEDDERLQAMIDELKDMLDKAERQRLADPWFIQDMRDVLQRYDWPWSHTVYDETYQTASRRLPEPWDRRSGRFRVDGSLGLRTVFYPSEPAREDDSRSSGTSSTGEAVGQLLGQIIKQSLDGDSGDEGRREEEAEPEVEAAVAVLPVGFANAFAIHVTTTVRPLDTRGQQVLAFGPYQGGNAVAGYRLVYQPGAADGGLSLIKRSSRGTVSTIEFGEGAPDLTDGARHDIVWTRSRRGRMQVTVDGRQVIDVVDRGFNDSFAGLVIRNEGGDYAFNRIAVQAMP
ncbi:MAG: hypothetical protein R3316_01110 [Rhodovibrionaceae bacterium]|nr:hypothetical protein [Rhodovibrionaceae bacterium]